MSHITSRGSSGGMASITQFTPNSGIVVVPTAGGNVTVVGGTGVTTVGTLNTLTINITGAVSTSFPTDSGTATPSSNVLNVLGGTAARDINTSGAGNTIHVDLNNTVTLGDLSIVLAGNPALTITSGDITISGTGVGAGGNLNLPTTASANVGVVEVNSTRFMHSFGTENTFVGSGSGNFSLTSTGHVGIGSGALSSLTGAGLGPNDNVAVGSDSLNACTSSGGNVALGGSALASLTAGDGVNSGNNVAVGWVAGNLLTGSGNVIIGSNALQDPTGAASYNIVIGFGTGNALATNESSNILIGNAGVVAESHVMRLGTTGSTANTLQVNKCYIAGIDGVNVGSVAKVLTMASDQVGTATVTAGAGITVTPGANTITIAASGMGAFTWAVTTIDAPIVVNNGYIANKVGLLTMTLPATASVGDTIAITNINTAVGWRIAQNANQKINVGSSSTTVGAAGYVEATALGDTVTLVCIVGGASTFWQATSMVGNLTIN